MRLKFNLPRINDIINDTINHISNELLKYQTSFCTEIHVIMIGISSRLHSHAYWLRVCEYEILKLNLNHDPIIATAIFNSKSFIYSIHISKPHWQPPAYLWAAIIINQLSFRHGNFRIASKLNAIYAHAVHSFKCTIHFSSIFILSNSIPFFILLRLL